MTYLDNAASSQTVDSSIKAVSDYHYNYRANVHRGDFKTSTIASEKYDEARGNFISTLELDPDFILANLYINEPDAKLKEKYRKRAFLNYSKANPYELYLLKSDSLIKDKGWWDSYQERKDLFNTIEDIYTDIPEIFNITSFTPSCEVSLRSIISFFQF